MKRVTKIAIGAAAALTLALAAAAVSAHPHGHGPGCDADSGAAQEMGPGGHGAMGHGQMDKGQMGQGPGGHGMGPHARGNPAAAAERHLSVLKSKLKITAAQEPAWKAFAEQTKQRAEDMHAWMSAAQGSKQATAPERMDLRNQMMKKRQEQMEKETAAFKDLYAVLTPEQKTLADQRVGMMGGRGMAFNSPAR